MSDYPNDPKSPEGQYATEDIDIATWNPDEQHWELQGIPIPDLPEGRNLIARERAAQPGKPATEFRLVYVQATTTISDLEEI
jgi:hypothetical protein